MKKGFRRLFSAFLSCLIIVPAMSFEVLAKPALSIDDFREQFYKIQSDDGEGVHSVNVDSNIIHKPQEFIKPSLLKGRSLPSAAAPQESFTQGSSKTFLLNNVNGGGTKYNIKGNLIAQESNVNLWILDDADYHAKTGSTHGGDCTLTLVNSAMAAATAGYFNSIYKSMTDPATGFGVHSGNLIEAGFSNLPYLGDMQKDGRVNVLLYDLYGDGNRSGKGGYTAGFFYGADFFSTLGGQAGNQIDLLHMDIGKLDGFSVLISTDENSKLDFMGTFAHELQHMLFYMHLGVYMGSLELNSSYLWLNEALSGLADMYYTKPGVQMLSTRSRLTPAAQNEYTDSRSLGGGSYGDFLNFNNSFKNYGMGYSHSAMMYKLTQKTYGSKIHGYFDGSALGSDFWKKYDNINDQSSDEVIGNGFKAVLGESFKDFTSLEVFKYMYFMFMENFAADGGSVLKDGKSYSSFKISDSLSNANNLWYLRPRLGKEAVYDDADGYTGSLSYGEIPLLENGGRVQLKGYGSGFSGGASHERLYLLGSNSQNPFISVSLPKTAGMEYYIAIPDLNSAKGAEVHRVSSGTQVFDTQGKQAYLFVVSLRATVDTNAAVTWYSSMPKLNLSSIYAAKMPNKTSYYSGQKFDKTGLSVMAKFTDGTEKDVTRDVAITPTGALTTGNTYVRISYTYEGITKSTTLPVKVTTAAGTPTLKVSAVSYTTAKISWAEISGASGYELYRSTSASGAYTKVYTAASGKILSRTDTGLAAGKTYYYKIKAYRAVGGQKLYSYTSRAVAATTKRAELSSVYVTAKPKKTAYFSGQRFDKAGLAVAAKFTDSTSKNITSAAVITPTGALTTGNTYVRISYTYGGVTKSTTLPVKVTAAASTPVARIAGMSYNAARISWNVTSGASGYELYRAPSANGTYTRVYTATSSKILTRVDSSLTTGRVYYYKVRAYRAVGSSRLYGAFSKPVAVRPSLSAPSSSVRGGSKTVRTSWSKVQGATGYQLYRATSANGSYTYVKKLSSSTLSYLNTGLKGNAVYYYRVRAYRTVGGTVVYGSFSSPKGVRTAR